jgi:branched-chain amino acid transport system permease protein
MTKFFSLLQDGLALGAVYALVALGFVVIYRATGVINFAQGGLVVFGAFLVYQAQHTWDLFGGGNTWPGFIIAALFAMVCVALIGAAFEALVLRRMIGQPIFAIILITIGLFLLVEPITTTIWHNPPGGLETPFGLQRVTVGDVRILQVNIATVVLGAIVLGGFFLLFQYTKIGVAMRATAVDQEAALAQGISVRRVFALSWAIAGAVAVVAGMMLAGGAGPAPGLSINLGLIALRAFPAIILGGLDSPGGAVVGGLTIGIAQVMTGGYISSSVEVLGAEFADVVPYLIMFAILLVRPYGLFGTREVRRV